MYEFVTHTWNTIKGRCPHDCLYCYMKRWGNLKETRLDENEFRTDLGSGNFIFVGSSCDMFAETIPYMWIFETIQHCISYDQNRYLFQTKNPGRIPEFEPFLRDICPIICTTIESNRCYPQIMKHSPDIMDRVEAIKSIKVFTKFVTIEPILDFDLAILVEMIKSIEPEQVNIGADSGNHNLPEPRYHKILDLVSELSKFTKVENKRNLNRLKSDHPQTKP